MRLLPILLLFALTAQAQPIRYFTHFTENEGLSANRVQCILRDQQGYLWVGTNNGLNRYDGYSFRHYLPDARQARRTVSNENIHDIKQDANGFIWLATSDGLNCYNPHTQTFRVWKTTEQNDKSLPNALIWSISIDENNQVWLACDNRDLCRFDPKTERFTTYPWKSFLDKECPELIDKDYKTIYSFQNRTEGKLWFLSNLGLFSFDITEETFDYHPYPETFHPKGKYTSAESFYMGSPGSDLLHFDACLQQWTQLKLPIPGSLNGDSRQVNHAFFMGQNLWVLAREGLFQLDTSTLKMVHVEPSPNNRSTAPTGNLTTGFLEKNGMLWLGGENGLWRYDPAAQHFSYTSLMPENTRDCYNTYYRFLDAPHEGRRYALDFFGKKIEIIEKGQWVKTIHLPGFAAAIFEDAEGEIWLSGGQEIFRLDRKALNLLPFSIPSEWLGNATSSIFCDIAQDAAGNFWFANDQEGILVWRPRENEWWKPGEKEAFVGRAVSDLLADHEQQTVWIATQDYGLFRFDENTGKFTLYRKEETDVDHSLAAYIVNGLCKDGHGYIWAATTPGGLSRFDYDSPTGRQFLTLNSDDGLPSNQVFSALTDAAGNVWAGTSKGIAWVDARRLRVRSFGKRDGMTSDVIDLPLSLAANGEILIGTACGYQSVHPDSLLKEKMASGILLTSFRIFDQEYLDSLIIIDLKKIDLSWQQNFFSFEFASTDFSQPQKNEYAYRLVNYDAGWVYLKNRHSASYTGVPPGHYVLEIKSGREGRWQEPGARLSIYISPPFWERWWFRSLVVLLIAAAIWALYRRRIGQIKREEALKTEFNQRIARTEMAALRAQMNPHFVFNCLSSINRFILVNQQDEASAYLTKFSRLIRMILDNSRSETISLNKELEALQLYVEMERMRFNDRFEFRFTVADDVQTEHLEIPPLLIQPYVENAIWHGLMHKKSPGVLQLRVFYEGKKCCIEIEDDGVGRQRAMALKSRSATINKSHGMKVTAERLEVINQLYGTNAQVQTADLLDGQGEVVGTKVRIEF